MSAVMSRGISERNHVSRNVKSSRKINSSRYLFFSSSKIKSGKALEGFLFVTDSCVLFKAKENEDTILLPKSAASAQGSNKSLGLPVRRERARANKGNWPS